MKTALHAVDPALLLLFLNVALLMQSVGSGRLDYVVIDCRH